MLGCSRRGRASKIIIIIDNAWMIGGLKLSSMLPKVANKS